MELVRFLEENREEIESEENGEFIYASLTEMEAPTIDAIRHQRGQATHDYLSLDEIEPNEEDIDIWDFASWDDDKIRRILEKYALQDE